jgi:MOSC domain-containing protein YiiM
VGKEEKEEWTGGLPVATIVAICTSDKKGVRKLNVLFGELIPDHGLKGDAHAGSWPRQVSLLAIESIKKMQEMGLQVGPGDFAENITTEGIELYSLPLGTLIQLGDDAVGEVTQIGKECHIRCGIFYEAGDCIMPREGIFVKILKGGHIRIGDKVSIIIKEAGEML